MKDEGENYPVETYHVPESETSLHLLFWILDAREGLFAYFKSHSLSLLDALRIGVSDPRAVVDVCEGV